MRVVLTGGGTGGHVTPLIAVANALRRMAEAGAIQEELGEPTLEILYVGVVTDMDRAALDAAGILAVHVPSGKIRRYLSGAPHTVVDLVVRLPLGVLRALWTLFFVMPDVVFSKGGYGSVPVSIASWVYRIPILLHETDLIPGVANRSAARYASAIAVGFRAAESAFPPAKVFVTGTPLRRAFEQLPDRHVARQRLNLHDEKPVIFVTGGSQGAQRLNTALLTVLPMLVPRAQIMHQVGAKNLPAIQDFLRKDLRQLPGIGDYHPVGFIGEEDMAAAFAAADLVISRAGGTALAEIAAAGKPSILVPLREAAQQHQWENAYFFREQGAAIVLDEANLTPAIFVASIERALHNPQDLRLMGERAHVLHRPHAADELARVLVAMAHGQVPRREVSPRLVRG